MIEPNLKGQRMEHSIASAHPASGESARVLIECGLWLRVVLIGACALAAGLHLLFDAAARPLVALALVLGGGALAALSWWRAQTILETTQSPAGSESARRLGTVIEPL
jgi:hypothetical protein